MSRPKAPPWGFTYVVPSPEERAAWRAARGHQLPPRRVACRACGARLWSSGLGVGSHRRACKGGLA